MGIFLFIVCPVMIAIIALILYKKSHSGYSDPDEEWVDSGTEEEDIFTK
jgi:hypothetical protein